LKCLNKKRKLPKEKSTNIKSIRPRFSADVVTKEKRNFDSTDTYVTEPNFEIDKSSSYIGCQTATSNMENVTVEGKEKQNNDLSANVKNSKISVCCVCFKLFHSRKDEDDHFAQYHKFV